jgi:hypothetical protein
LQNHRHKVSAQFVSTQKKKEFSSNPSSREVIRGFQWALFT